MKRFYLIAGLWAALFSAKAQQVGTFDDFNLEPDSWYNGSDGSGGFNSGGFWFPNDYNADWGSWSGFAVSNMKNTVTAGYENQFSAIAGSGSTLSENYAVVYWPGELKMEFDSAVDIFGFGITNSTYAYLAMRDGDSNGYSKKFGGMDGTEPDSLKLLVWGADTLGNLTDTVTFFLADYRFENPKEDYLVKTWEWMNLNSLGAVKELYFGMESSDVGDWGINTPTYFCMDNFTASRLTSALNVKATTQELNVFPNPVTDVFYIDVPESAKKLVLFESTGSVVLQQHAVKHGRLRISTLSGRPTGIYFLRVLTNDGWQIRKIVKM